MATSPLQLPSSPSCTAAAALICKTVSNIDPEGETICFAKQCQCLAASLAQLPGDDAEIGQLFGALNRRALEAEQMAINLPAILATTTLEAVRFKNCTSTVRTEVLKILQFNFKSYPEYKRTRLETAYNSITMLGEFYNRLRIFDKPILVLGQSLLELLEKELRAIVVDRVDTLEPMFAKLMLTQITLNGIHFRTHHQVQLNAVLDLIRRILVEVTECGPRARAFLLMTLDLFYSNFTANAMVALQKVYGGYLVPEGARNGRSHNKRLKVGTVERAAQTEVAVADVFRAGPPVVPPTTRVVLMQRAATTTVENEGTTMTSPVVGTPEKTAAMSTATTPSSCGNKSASRIDPRIRSVKIGRIYPSPVKRANGIRNGRKDSSSEDEVARLSKANVMAHDLAQMKENRSSQMNRIRNEYLDRIPSPNEMVYPTSDCVMSGGGGGGSAKNSQYSGNGGGKHLKYKMDEDVDNGAFDTSYFDDIMPLNEHSKSFLQFLENK